MSHGYDDILHLPHPTSRTHPRMSRQDRAAQFSPFAALVGYEDVVKETARLTEQRLTLTEDEVAELDIRLRLAVELDAEIAVTWFRPDARKDGGSYVTTTGRIRKVNRPEQVLTMEDGTQIPIREITAVHGAVFNFS